MSLLTGSPPAVCPQVRLAVMQRVYRYLSLRPYHFQPRRNSAFSGVYVTAEPGPTAIAAPPGAPRPPVSVSRHHTVEHDVGVADAAGVGAALVGAAIAGTVLDPLEPLSTDSAARTASAAPESPPPSPPSAAHPALRSTLGLLCCRAPGRRPSPPTPGGPAE